MSEKWYYGIGGKRAGPTPFAELQQLASSGQLAPTDLVWTDGMPNWVPAKEINGLFANRAIRILSRFASNTKERFSFSLPAWLAWVKPVFLTLAVCLPVGYGVVMRCGYDPLNVWNWPQNVRDWFHGPAVVPTVNVTSLLELLGQLPKDEWPTDFDDTLKVAQANLRFKKNLVGRRASWNVPSARPKFDSVGEGKFIATFTGLTPSVNLFGRKWALDVKKEGTSGPVPRSRPKAVGPGDTPGVYFFDVRGLKSEDAEQLRELSKAGSVEVSFKIMSARFGQGVLEVKVDEVAILGSGSGTKEAEARPSSEKSAPLTAGDAKAKAPAHFDRKDGAAATNQAPPGDQAKKKPPASQKASPPPSREPAKTAGSKDVVSIPVGAGLDFPSDEWAKFDKVMKKKEASCTDQFNGVMRAQLPTKKVGSGSSDPVGAIMGQSNRRDALHTCLKRLEDGINQDLTRDDCSIRVRLAFIFAADRFIKGRKGGFASYARFCAVSQGNAPESAFVPDKTQEKTLYEVLDNFGSSEWLAKANQRLKRDRAPYRLFLDGESPRVDWRGSEHEKQGSTVAGPKTEAPTVQKPVGGAKPDTNAPAAKSASSQGVEGVKSREGSRATTAEEVADAAKRMNMDTLKQGSGDAAKAGQFVTVHYVGTLPDGKEFDSSVKRNAPFGFLLGQNKVIKGWELGVVGMKVGEQRRLTIPPELAYGRDGFPPRIPANTELIYVIELLAITPAAEGDETKKPQPDADAVRKKKEAEKGDSKDRIVWDFEWPAVPRATQYNLFVIGPKANRAVIDVNVTDKTYHYVSDSRIIEENSRGWRWRVRANVDGKWSQWSEDQTFDVQASSSEPRHFAIQK